MNVSPNIQHSQENFIFLSKRKKEIIKPSAIFGDHTSETQVQLEECRKLLAHIWLFRLVRAQLIEQLRAAGSTSRQRAVQPWHVILSVRVA
ncbi:hypothetical protein EYF80_029461 [Liparis tanakae]|uniref:Uncharacterized protein n=1 Tax=Liparis tanakae TaxID=230148 RepID=A0A4Z2H3B0_9TELE|nr:hypothetical protein EYF80_029461 [Liparis tanakae]